MLPLKITPLKMQIGKSLPFMLPVKIAPPEIADSVKFTLYAPPENCSP